MTRVQEVGKFIENNPKGDGITTKNYLTWVGSQFGLNYNSTKDYWYRYRLESKLVVTKKVINPRGDETITQSIRHAPEVDKRGLQIESVTEMAWGGVNVRYKRVEDLTIEQIEDSVEKLITKINKDKIKSLPKLPRSSSEKILRVIITDEHVGLDVEYENSIFEYDYNGEKYLNSIGQVFSNIVKEHKTHGTFDEIHLVHLGDAQDGQNAKTTRSSHTLKQNMSNEEVFDLCLETRLRLIQNIYERNIAKKIKTYDVTNDNHSGSFGYYISSSAAKFCQRIYDKNLVECNVLKKFIEHFEYGDHCFLLTHGKDKEYMKHGMPVIINNKVESFIRDYIDHHNISNPYIQLNKGDSHQLGYSRCKKFEYLSYGSFAPPSGYIQTNYGDCYSSYSIQVVPKGNSAYSNTNYFLDYKR